MNIPFFSKSKKEKLVKNSKSKKKDQKVIIYSTKTCPWCKKAKELFKENGIKFNNKDVSNKKNAQEMIKKSGQQSVPVIDIGGTVVIGFNEEKLRRELGL